MTADRMNLTGAWFGSYSYLGTGDPDVSFIANLEEIAGIVSGSVSEPNSIGDSSPQLNAMVRGNRDGAEVVFAKTYDGASDAMHRVDYAGTVNEAGTRVAGFWQLEDVSGSFEMTREHAEEKQEEQVIEVELEANAIANTAAGR